MHVGVRYALNKEKADFIDEIGLLNLWLPELDSNQRQAD